MKKRVKFAVCVDNRDYPASLELHKIYRVIEDPDAESEGDVRVIDESGEDYLYAAEYFMMIDLPARIKRAISVHESEVGVQRH